jgi:low temperature requirement protein LtrA
VPVTRAAALRSDEARDRVTNVELFFDLVYVFAVTRLSALLLEDVSVRGALETAVVLAMVWQIWVYTTWAVNYLDPDKLPTRVMLLVAMLASLVLASGIPQAYGDQGALVAGTYVTVQLVRPLYIIWALRGDVLQMVFIRILPWSAVSSVLLVLGALAREDYRAALWAAGIAIDLVAAGFGFWVPGLGRSKTTDWTISGAHFAERCQAFVLIALGESLVVIGGLARLEHAEVRDIAALALAFAGAVALWWIYFDRSAEDSAARIESSDDPGRIARDAFHWVHILLVGGIIVSAAADEFLLNDPGRDARGPIQWLMLGGTALFLGAHALFKAVVWRVASWPRIVAVVVLLALVPLGPHMTVLGLGAVTVAIVVAVAITDRVLRPFPSPSALAR